MRIPKGLSNLGNTCYMNSLLQVLLNLHSFNEELKKVHPRKFRKIQNLTNNTTNNDTTNKSNTNGNGNNNNDKDKINDKDNDKDFCCSELNCIVCCYLDLVDEMDSNRYSFITPTEFKSKFGYLCREYDNFKQHDSALFFLDLISKMNDCLLSYNRNLRNLKNTNSKNSNNTNNTNSNINSNINDTNHTNSNININSNDNSNNLTLIDRYFRGEVTNITTSQCCNVPKKKDDVVYNLSLGFSDKSLNKIISNSFEPEVIDTHQGCSKCDKQTQVLHYTVIKTFPKILCIHVKLYKTAFGISYKISSELNFERFIEVQGMRYELYATVIHSGMLNFGHYTSAVSVLGMWFNCDDTVISKVSEKNVLNSTPYVFFYRLVEEKQ